LGSPYRDALIGHIFLQKMLVGNGCFGFGWMGKVLFASLEKSYIQPKAI
jgi:hypothetical protein